MKTKTDLVLSGSTTYFPIKSPTMVENKNYIIMKKQTQNKKNYFVLLNRSHITPLFTDINCRIIDLRILEFKHIRTPES